MAGKFKLHEEIYYNGYGWKFVTVSEDIYVFERTEGNDYISLAIREEELIESIECTEGMGVPIKPSHYSNRLDAWAIADANFSEEELNGFDIGNVLKYVIRYKDKDGLKDLKKARDYLDRIIARKEQGGMEKIK